MITKMWEDDEIGGRIYLQLCNLFVDQIVSDQKDSFFRHAFSVMHKLTATKYHLNNYEKIEQKQFQQARRKFKKNPNETRESFELIFELESFLYQVKSSLDMLIKLLEPIIGAGTVRTKTYSNKGEDLIKGLVQYKKKKGVHIEMVDTLISLVRLHKDNWLEDTVTLRDKLNHVEGLKNYKFLPVKLPNGEISAIKPRFRDMNTLPFLNLVYLNNMVFHQDFMAFSLAIKIGPSFTLLPEDKDRALKTFNHKSAKFVKWCWGLNRSSES